MEFIRSRRKPILVALLSVSLLGFFCCAQASEDTAKPPPKQQSSIEERKDSVDTPWLLEALESAFKTPLLTPAPSWQALTLDSWVSQVLAIEPTIKAAKAKEAETKARQKSVKSKRVLFLFKFFNAQYLEGSAENDLKADQFQTKAIQQKAAKLATKQWFTLKKAFIATQIAYISLDEARQNALASEQQFKAGRILHGDLLQAQATLLEKAQAYQSNIIHFNTASNAMSERLQEANDIDEATKGRTLLPLLPKEIALSDSTTKTEQLKLTKAPNVTTPQLPLVTFILPEPKTLVTVPNQEDPTVIFNRRDDAQAMAYRVKAMEQMVLAASMEFNKPQLAVLEASLEQLKHRQTQQHQAIQAKVIQAKGKCTEATQSYQTAWQQWQLAQQITSEAKLLVKTGFGSQHQYQSAQRLSQQAKLKTLMSYLDWLDASHLYNFETGKHVRFEPKPQ